jgi:hypothetical protein
VFLHQYDDESQMLMMNHVRSVIQLSVRHQGATITKRGRSFRSLMSRYTCQPCHPVNTRLRHSCLSGASLIHLPSSPRYTATRDWRSSWGSSWTLGDHAPVRRKCAEE